MTKGVENLVGAAGVRRLLAAIASSDGCPPEVLRELQRALSEVEATDRGNGVLSPPNDRMAALLLSFVATRAADRQTADGATMGARLAEEDLASLPGWLAARTHRRPFVVPSRETIKVPNQFRLALLGDWGSGSYGASVSAATIESSAPAFDAVLHLGGVYYAGTRAEVVERFLNLWPDVPGARSWALNSNREMFSGGEGYFDVTLADQRFAGQRGSSCFAWENDYFLFLGLDTGYEEHKLGSEQQAWLHAVANARPHKKLILFSHHEPFSALEPATSEAGATLALALRGLLQERRVAAWYWGHEQRCVFFEQHAQWGVWGRCVGHGGVPRARDYFAGPPESTNIDGSSWRSVQPAHVPEAWVLDGPNGYVPGHEEEYAPNGYVSLHFERAVVHEEVRAPDGTLLLAHDAS